MIPSTQVLSAKVLFTWIGGRQCFSQAASTCSHLGHLWDLGVPRLGCLLFSPLVVFTQMLQASNWTLALLATHPQTYIPFHPDSSFQIEPVMLRVFKRLSLYGPQAQAPDTNECPIIPPK